MRIKVTAKTKTRTKTIVSLSMFLVLVSFFCDKVASSSSSSDDDDDEDIWDNERFKLTSKNIEAADDDDQVRLNFHGLTEEEQGSLQVPLLMRCDACRAISFVLTKDLRKFERIRGRGRALGKRLQAVRSSSYYYYYS